MTEKQQIEEMAKIMSTNCGECDTCKFNDMRLLGDCTYYLIANELYEQGYRKIDEGSVVLTEDEVFELRKDQAEVKFLKKQIQDQARKETAKEILASIYDTLNTCQICKDKYYTPHKYGYDVDAIDKKMSELEKQYGVEL